MAYSVDVKWITILMRRAKRLRYCHSKKNTDVKRLAYDLRQVNTMIVMVYRHFYDWVASIDRQRLEKVGYSRTGFAAWLSDSEMQHCAYDHYFTTSVYSRYAPHFSDIRVHTHWAPLLWPVLLAMISMLRAFAIRSESQTCKRNTSKKKEKQLSASDLRRGKSC